MVAPIAAAAASRLAPAIRSAGGKWMHSSSKGVRSMGGKMLGTSNKKVEKKITDMAKFTNMSVKLLGKISKGVGKLVGFLAKHSPALKQQLIVIGKAFSVMIRPIGDIMARFIRPMAIWVMKVAQKWYAMVTKRKKGGMNDPDDAIKAVEDIIESKKAAGIDTTEDEKKLAELKAEQPETSGGGGPFAKIFKELIPEGFKEALSAIGETFKGLWSILKELGLLVWDIVGPGVKRLAGFLGLALVGALKVVTFVFEGLGVVLKAIGLGIKTVREYFDVLKAWLQVFAEWLVGKFIQVWKSLDETVKKVWNWIKTVFITGWQSLKESLAAIGSWLKDTFLSAWNKLKDGMQTLVDKVLGWAKKIRDAWSNAKDKVVGGVKKAGGWVKDKLGFASGGDVRTTGPYILHAGERVLNAGETARSVDKPPMTFNTSVNLQATINNDLDIEMVARKLAEYNETELRRRVSYF